MKSITVNGKKLYRHFHPLFPSAFILTEEESFMSHHPPSGVLIVGSKGSYLYKGKLYKSDSVYDEVLRVCGKPLRNVVFFDGKLGIKPLYVAEDYFITLVSGEPVLVKNDKEIRDINRICATIYLSD